MARGVGLGLFEGGDYFQYFHLRGADSQREAINRGTAIIPQNTVSFSFFNPVKRSRLKNRDIVKI